MRRFVTLFSLLAAALAAPLAHALTEVVDGIEWTFTISNDEATIGTGKQNIAAISTEQVGPIVIPETLGGVPVTTIGDKAFYYCTRISSVKLPSTVNKIGNGAFDGCSSLTSVNIPNGVTFIGDHAFSECAMLTSVTLPNSVVTIEDCAFSNCSSLTSVNIPSHITSINAHLFWGCSSLTSVDIPEGVTKIEGGAFIFCSSLKSLIIPEGVTSIGTEAFRGCSSLTSVVFKGNVPQGFADSSLLGKPIAFPKKYVLEWELVLNGLPRSSTFLDLLLPEHVQVEAQAKTLTPKTIQITYTVKSELPSVKVRAVAWKDGKRSFANIVPVQTGEGVPKGESVTTNEEHTFVWDVASDWATDLDKVAVEILVQEGTLLPQELITIPATKTHPAMTITRNALAEPWLFDALVWCVAEGDERLSVIDGLVFVDGTNVAQGEFLDIGITYYEMKTALLNFLYGKMGYKVLAGEELEYAEMATRLDFADIGLSQVSVKIEEGE